MHPRGYQWVIYVYTGCCLKTAPRFFDLLKKVLIHYTARFGKLLAHFVTLDESFQMHYTFTNLRKVTYEKSNKHWIIDTFILSHKSGTPGWKQLFLDSCFYRKLSVWYLFDALSGLKWYLGLLFGTKWSLSVVVSSKHAQNDFYMTFLTWKTCFTQNCWKIDSENMLKIHKFLTILVHIFRVWCYSVS